MGNVEVKDSKIGKFLMSFPVRYTGKLGKDENIDEEETLE